LIMSGEVLVGTERVQKPGAAYPDDTVFRLRSQPPRFVSRGGLKLERALDIFALNPAGLTVLDVGASTGGFTDCLLQRGATRVYAVDVGYGQLAWRLREDPRVIVMERTNFRYIEPDRFENRAQAAVMDVSFISVSKLLAPLRACVADAAWVVLLVKPQFEAGPGRVGKGGIVRDPSVHRDVLLACASDVSAAGFRVCGLEPSPVRGADGNIEFLMCARVAEAADQASEWPFDFADIVERAHRELLP
ncbi:MAG: TlyA family RNA methyltransferase, partial [Firmicutes bacterium]|nr:TlyA family RNA methyltransferase [Bacillota bacterium]